MSVHLLDNEIQVLVADLFKLHGDLSHQIKDESPQGVEIIQGKTDARLLLQVLKIYPGVTEKNPIAYLQDILKNIRTDSVTVSLRDSQSAALIKPVTEAGEETGVLCLLMPLRLTGD